MSIDATLEATRTAECAARSFPRAELTVRERDGIGVTLFWVCGTGVLVVAVADQRDGTSFELVLEPGDRALDVFHHPYAYAAARGIDTGPVVCEHDLELADA